MNNRESIDFAISGFLVLERQLCDCMEDLPFIDANKQAVSPKFIPIIMDSCSLIDSIFFQNTEKDGKRRFSLKNYSDMHEPSLQLDNNSTLFLASPIQILRPYRDWTREAPVWWSAYNALKHDRFNNHHLATFSNAVQGLAGLHQLMVRQRDFLGGFLKAGWIDTQDGNVGDQLAGAAHAGCGVEIVVESKLFASATGENFVNPDTSDEQYFDIDYNANGLSMRIRNMIFGHEDW